MSAPGFGAWVLAIYVTVRIIVGLNNMSSGTGLIGGWEAIFELMVIIASPWIAYALATVFQDTQPWCWAIAVPFAVKAVARRLAPAPSQETVAPRPGAASAARLPRNGRARLRE